jgi:hypothetical protein
MSQQRGKPGLSQIWQHAFSLFAHALFDQADLIRRRIVSVNREVAIVDFFGAKRLAERAACSKPTPMGVLLVREQIDSFFLGFMNFRLSRQLSI